MIDEFDELKINEDHVFIFTPNMNEVQFILRFFGYELNPDQND